MAIEYSDVTFGPYTYKVMRSLLPFIAQLKTDDKIWLWIVDDFSKAVRITGTAHKQSNVTGAVDYAFTCEDIPPGEEPSKESATANRDAITNSATAPVPGAYYRSDLNPKESLYAYYANSQAAALLQARPQQVLFRDKLCRLKKNAHYMIDTFPHLDYQLLVVMVDEE